MAKVIPPKYFFKLSKEQQEAEAVRRMNECYSEGDTWKRVAQAARVSKIVEPEERPDEDLLKT